jgi:hypothetical protein
VSDLAARLSADEIDVTVTEHAAVGCASLDRKTVVALHLNGTDNPAHMARTTVYTFTPDQARRVARLLLEVADEAEAVLDATPLCALCGRRLEADDTVVDGMHDDCATEAFSTMDDAEYEARFTIEADHTREARSEGH